MARNKQLQELVAQLRAETGRNQSVAVGTSELDNMKVQIRGRQEILYDDYDWPFLRVQRTVTLSAGQRYYDFPSDLNYDRTMVVKFKFGGVFLDVERGIGFDEYSIYDSNEDERASPVLRWDVRDEDEGGQLEVWPVPNAAGTLHFFGTKSLSPLIEDDDTADLDDLLIILPLAVEYLERQKSPDAKTKLNLAQQRLTRLRSNSQAGSKTIQVGLGGKTRPSHTGKTVLIVGS